MRRLSAAAMAWAGFVPPRGPAGSAGPFCVACLLTSAVVLFVCWRTRPAAPPAPVEPVEQLTASEPVEQPAEECPIHPWAVSVRVEPNGVITYYARDPIPWIIEEVLQEASSPFHVSAIE